VAGAVAACLYSAGAGPALLFVEQFGRHAGQSGRLSFTGPSTVTSKMGQKIDLIFLLDQTLLHCLATPAEL
jgi:hypothetical protein